MYLNAQFNATLFACFRELGALRAFASLTAVPTRTGLRAGANVHSTKTSMRMLQLAVAL